MKIIPTKNNQVGNHNRKNAKTTPMHSWIKSAHIKSLFNAASCAFDYKFCT
jgi:hypothetical protein